MFFTGHTSSTFLFSHLVGFNPDACLVLSAMSNLNDLLPIAIDGGKNYLGLYKTLHKPDKATAAHLWLLILIYIVFFPMGLHWFFDYLTHKKEGGRNWLYYPLDITFTVSTLIYCYLTF